MATNLTPATIKLRRDTAANWTVANPTLSVGEPGLEIDTGKFKIGNGAAWNSILDYYNPGAGGVTDGDKTDVVVSGTGAIWTVNTGSINNAKLATMPTKTYKGRTSAATGVAEDVSTATLKTDLNAATGNWLAGLDPVTISENTEAEFDAGTIVSTQGNADNTLTLANAANGTTKAVRFKDSRTNKIQIAHNAAYDITGDITIEAWAYVETATATAAILAKGSGTPMSMYITAGGNEYGSVVFSQGGQSLGNGFTAFVLMDCWNHVAITKSGTTGKIYINGVLSHTATFNPTVTPNGDPLYIGYVPDAAVGSYVFRGNLQEVRLWNVARSVTEIANNMNAVLVGNETGLVGYWRLSEGSGTSIDDLTATNNNGTLSGNNYSWQTVTNNYSTSGNRTSPVYDVSAAGTITTSKISWTQLLPIGHTLVVETRFSVNGGSSYSAWAAATNGGTVSGLTSSTDMSNGRIQIRETFTSPSAKESATISNVAVVLTTPAFLYKVGAQTSSPQAVIDAGLNAIQGKLLDTGGAVINIAAPRYGGAGDGVTPNDAAFALALADLGLVGDYTTSTGKIIFPKGDFLFDAHLELNHVCTIEGAGGDRTAPATTLLFADGKGIKVPAAEVLGGYGTDQGAGKGSLIKSLKILSVGSSNAPTSTVNISGLVVTRTAGAFFETEKWGQHQIVKIGALYARVALWDSETQCTLAPFHHRGVVSGSTVNLSFGNGFPAGLINVAVKIDGVSYNLHASTASTTSLLTLSSAPVETGNRTIEIQSLGTLTSQTMTMYVNHGIEAGGTVHLDDVTIEGFAGNGVDLNTANYNVENARNCNTCNFYNVISIDNEGHGLFVNGFNSNACVFSGVNAFNNRGAGIWDTCSFGNTYVGPHADSNSMYPFYAANASVIIGLYTEGNQPPVKLLRPGGAGVTGPTLIGGFAGASSTYDSNALIISDTGDVRGLSSLSLLTGGSGIISNSPLRFDREGGAYRLINFGYGVAGSTQSAAILQEANALVLATNTFANGVPTDTASPSWQMHLSTGGGACVWYYAPPTAGTPSYSEVARINSTGLSGNGSQLTALNASNASTGTLSDARLSSNVVLYGTDILQNSAALDFGSIAANTTAELTIAVTGVVSGDSVMITPTGAPESGLQWSGYVSAADTVTVRLANTTTSAIDPASRTWRTTVLKV